MDNLGATPTTRLLHWYIATPTRKLPHTQHNCCPYVDYSTARPIRMRALLEAPSLQSCQGPNMIWLVFCPVVGGLDECCPLLLKVTDPTPLAPLGSNTISDNLS